MKLIVLTIVTITLFRVDCRERPGQQEMSNVANDIDDPGFLNEHVKSVNTDFSVDSTGFFGPGLEDVPYPWDALNNETDVNPEPTPRGLEADDLSGLYHLQQEKSRSYCGPRKVFMKLQRHGEHLGTAIITLDGERYYPRLALQMLQLFTGYNKADGSMRGVGFPWLYNYHQPAEFLYCNAYMGPNDHIITTPLFPVEEHGTQGGVPIIPGQVRAMNGKQRTGWIVITKASSTEKWSDPIIGHITTGMNIIQDAIAKGKDYVTAMKITESGVIIGSCW